MRVYVSGPMTSMPERNIPAFNAAAKRLREQGHFVINPAELSAMFGTEEEIDASFDYLYFPNEGDDEWGKRIACGIMEADLAAVRSCDAIYLLRGWEESRGAKEELAEALKHGLRVIQEGN